MHDNLITYFLQWARTPRSPQDKIRVQPSPKFVFKGPNPNPFLKSIKLSWV